ncbi:MAG: dTMP kinase [Candidatus Brocadiales bacterium]
MEGKLVAIEGIDGSGKTVQAHLLVERLKKEGRPVVDVRFPHRRQGFFGKMVHRYLNGEFGSAEQVNPYLAAILYAGERFEVKGELEGWLAEGKVVVARRYVPSNQAHQGGKLAEPHQRKRFFEWVEELEYEMFGNPRPDITVYLELPSESAIELIKRRHREESRQERKRDIHEENPSHLRAAENSYKELASSGAPWVTVPCMSDGKLLHEGEIAKKVWAAVSKAIA